MTKLKYTAEKLEHITAIKLNQTANLRIEIAFYLFLLLLFSDFYGCSSGERNIADRFYLLLSKNLDKVVQLLWTVRGRF